MVFKTWLSDINKVALAMDGLQNIAQFETDSAIANGMELSAVAVNKYKTSIEGLTLSQAKTALSTTALNEAQQNQILISAGLITSTESVTAADVKQTVAENVLTTAKQQEVLATFEAEMAEGKMSLERLQAIALEDTETGAIARVILAKKEENVQNLKNIASGKALTTVLKEQLIALASNPITWVVAGLAGAAIVLHNTSKAIDEVRQSANELNGEFSDYKSSIDEYKTQIEDLYKTINDSNSSVEDVTTARQTLMTVQDELIDKFGKEKETIDLVTDAINGQSFALDILSQKKWQETKNKFNESDVWNNFANWQEGYSDNIDRMVSEMENAWGNIKMSTSDYFGGEYDDIIKRLEEAGWEYSSAYETFIKGGSVKDLYEELLDIQNLVGDDVPDNFLNSLTDDANELKVTLDSYEGMWDNYILNDKIFADDELADSWKEVNDAYTKYQNAVASGDKTAIEEAISGFATSINEVLNDENVSDSVKDYFKDMYPALYREVEKWEFKTNIIPKFDTSELQGKTQADVLEMLQTDDIQDGENEFNSIVESAIKYGLILDDDTKGIQKILDLLVEWGILQGTISDTTPQFTDKTDIFKSFNDTEIGQRLQHATKLFNEGKISYKEYFNGLQTEIENVDFSHYTDSLEDAQNAAGQLFVDTTQQTAQGLTNLINSFNSNEMSVTEYIDSYLSIAETLGTLTDELQENSEAWDKNGKALSESENMNLDGVQSDLNSAIETIKSYQDSIYGLEQILSGKLELGTDEFAAQTNVIAEDLANIVSSGGEMSEEIKNYMGNSADEIAQSLTEDISNFDIASQAIAANTNVAIQNMATSIGELFEELGKAISDFKVDLSFGVSSITMQDVDMGILGTHQLPAVTFSLEASGDSLSSIGSAISSFGKNFSENLGQYIEYPDFTIEPEGDEYVPGDDVLSNYNDKLEKLKDASGKSGGDAGDAYVEAYEKELKELENLRDRGEISEAEYLSRMKALYEKYFAGISKYQDKYFEEQGKYLSGMLDLYNSALSGISKLLGNKIDAVQEEKDATISALEEERDARLEVIEAQKEQLQAEIDLIDEQIDAKQEIIDGIQDEIDKMREANEERKRQQDLMLAQYNLQKMLSQRTKLVKYMPDTIVI